MDNTQVQVTKQTNFFTHLYLTFANGVVSDHVRKGELSKISRASIEMQVLEEIDKSNFHLKYRIALVNTLLNTDTFDIYWISQRYQHSLPNRATARLQADMSLVDEIKSPYQTDEPEIESDNSSTVSNPSPQKPLGSGESPPSSPLSSRNASKAVVTNGTAAAGDTAVSNEDEFNAPKSIEQAPRKPISPDETKEEFWRDPALNPLSRFPSRPRPGSAKLPVGPATRQRTLAPSSGSGSDTDSDFDSSTDDDIPIDPRLTNPPFTPIADPPPSPPADTPTQKSAAKSKKGGILSGDNNKNSNNKKRKAVRFDLSNENANEKPDEALPAPTEKKARTTRAISEKARTTRATSEKAAARGSGTSNGASAPRRAAASRGAAAPRATRATRGKSETSGASSSPATVTTRGGAQRQAAKKPT